MLWRVAVTDVVRGRDVLCIGAQGSCVWQGAVCLVCNVTWMWHGLVALDHTCNETWLVALHHMCNETWVALDHTCTHWLLYITCARPHMHTHAIRPIHMQSHMIACLRLCLSWCLAYHHASISVWCVWWCLAYHHASICLRITMLVSICVSPCFYLLLSPCFYLSICLSLHSICALYHSIHKCLCIYKYRCR